MKKEYDKLVRDRIPEIIEEAGKSARVFQVSGNSLRAYALKKLREETRDTRRAGDPYELIGQESAPEIPGLQ